MSIDLINAVFASDLDPYERLVMLALADRADDATGACYPSIPDICSRTGMKERGVQNVVKRLVDLGVLSVNWGGGRHQRNTYFIKLNPAPDAVYCDKPRIENTVSHAETPHSITETPHPTTLNPAPDAVYCDKPRIENTVSHAETPHAVTETPHPTTLNPAPDAGEPSITTKEPPVVKVRAPDQILETLCKVQGVTDQAAHSFIAYRKRSKAKALSETGATRLASSLWEIVGQGGDPSDALGLAEERGWASVQPDWYFNAKGKSHDNRTQSNSRPARPGDGRGTVDAFAAVAARYAHPTQ